MTLWPPRASCPTSATPPTRCLLSTRWTGSLQEGEGQHAGTVGDDHDHGDDDGGKG